MMAAQLVWGAAPSTVWQITEQLSWSRGWSAVAGFMRRAAIGETAAHLEYLLERGEVSRNHGTPMIYTGLPAMTAAGS